MEQFTDESRTSTVLAVRYTRGDETTQPGGIMVRRSLAGEFMVHNFIREAGSKEPRSFFWGFYTFEEQAAWLALAEKISRCPMFSSDGGSIIEESEIEDKEL